MASGWSEKDIAVVRRTLIFLVFAALLSSGGAVAAQKTANSAPQSAAAASGHADHDQLTERFVREYQDGQMAAALVTGRQLLADADALRAEDGFGYANLLFLFADVLRTLGQFPEAAATYRAAIDQMDAVGQGDSQQAMVVASRLALTLRYLGRSAEGVPWSERALTALRRQDPPNPSNIAVEVGNLAQMLGEQGQFDRADAMLNEALGQLRVLDPRSPLTALTLANLGLNHYNAGRLADAERLFRQALDLYAARPADSAAFVPAAQGNLAVLLADTGRLSEAEAAARSSLAGNLSLYPKGHPDIANALNTLGTVLLQQNRHADAADMFTRTIAAARLAYGGDHPLIARFLGNLATTKRLLGQSDEALADMRAAAALSQQLLGPEHPETALALSNLALLLIESNQVDEARGVAMAAHRTMERVYDQPTPRLVASHLTLAMLAVGSDNAGEAEAQARAALELLDRIPGQPTAMRVSALLVIAGVRSRANPLDAEALRLVVEANRLVDQRRRLRLGMESVQDKTVVSAVARAAGIAQKQAGIDTLAVTALLHLVARRTETGKDTAALNDILFGALQQFNLSSAAEAMQRTAARAAAGTSALAAVVAQQQQLVDGIRAADKRQLDALARRDAPMVQEATEEVGRLARQLDAIDARLRTEFPAYQQMIDPSPLALAEVQRRLRPGEGLLLLVENGDNLAAVAVSGAGTAQIVKLGAAPTVRAHVARLRCQIDPIGCPQEQAPLSEFELMGFRAFDRQAAWEIYANLVMPVSAPLAQVRRLYVVNNGSLAQLPLALLPMAKPDVGDDAADPALLRATPWFGDRFALTTLPAVSALRSGGRVATGDRTATHDFVGYGAPTLAGAPAPLRGADAAGYLRVVDAGGKVLADVQALRALPYLPGTRAELESLAGALKASDDALRLGNAATERAVRSDPALREANVVAFATHGLLPREGSGLDEPGLVMTPPSSASEDDDGLLAASEAAQLDLVAEWVILSACNTASASGAAGIDSLSALARAFLFAGAHALLASHWRVGDAEAAALTIETLIARRENPALSRAEALQQAMRAVRTGKRPNGQSVDSWTNQWSHPAAWAPFTHIANADE